MNITIIAAVASNGVIGKDNTLLWRIPEDMKRFKELTVGKAVIMGRKTWESIPEKFRPLPDRMNIVISRNPDFEAPGAMVVNSLDDALFVSDHFERAIIGGGEIYSMALPIADRLELTAIHQDFDGDTYFPKFDRQEWQELSRVQSRKEGQVPYDFVTYSRTTE